MSEPWVVFVDMDDVMYVDQVLHLLLQGEFPETKISDQLYHFSYKNTTETCNTAMEQEFCRLFGDIFKDCENSSYVAEFAFFC